MGMAAVAYRLALQSPLSSPIEGYVFGCTQRRSTPITVLSPSSSRSGGGGRGSVLVDSATVIVVDGASEAGVGSFRGSFGGVRSFPTQPQVVVSSRTVSRCSPRARVSR